MMRRLFASLLLLAGFSAFAQTANVTYNLADFVGTPQAYSSITVTPFSAGIAGNTLVTGQARTLVTDGNGSATFSNMVMGLSYRVVARNYNYATNSGWTNVFPASLSGNINGKDWIIYSLVLPAGYFVYMPGSVTNALPTNNALPTVAGGFVYVPTNYDAAGAAGAAATAALITATNSFVAAGSIGDVVRTNAVQFPVLQTGRKVLIGAGPIVVTAYSNSVSISATDSLQAISLNWGNDNPYLETYNGSTLMRVYPTNIAQINGNTGAHLFDLNASGFTGNAATATVAGSANAVAPGINMAVGNVSGTFTGYGDMIYEAPPQAIWSAQTKPIFLVYIAPYPRQTTNTPQDTETTIVDKLNWWLPFIPSITNSGRAFGFQIDVGWAGRRNFNPAYVMTNNGSYASDVNMFPHGMPWLINKLNTNGVQVFLGAYGSTNTIPSGASGLMVPIQGGGSFTAYTNGVGTGLIASNTSGFKLDEMITADTIRGDFWQFRWWGVKAIIINTVDGYDPFNTIMFDKLANTAAQESYYPSGFNQTAGATYWNINPALIDWTATNNWQARGPVVTNIARSWMGFFTNLPPCAYYPYEGKGADITSLGTWTAVFKNGTMYNNSATPQTVRDWVTYFAAEYAGIDNVKSGARPISSPQTSIGANSIVPIISSENFAIDSFSTNQMTNCLPWATNAVIASIANDPLQAMPKKFADYPGWYVGISKPLFNGDTAVAIQYEGATNASIITLNFAADLGLSAGTYTATNIFCNSGGLASQTGGNVTLTMNQSSAMLLRVSPSAAIDTNSLIYMVNIHALGGASYRNPQNFTGAADLAVGNSTSKNNQAEVPNWATNCVNTVTIYFDLANGGFTNQALAYYFPTNNNGSDVLSYNVTTPVLAGGSHIIDFTFTNTWPDTNCIKGVNFSGQGATNGANVYIFKWKMLLTGPNRGTNY